MKCKFYKRNTISMGLAAILLTVLIGTLDIITTSDYRLFFFYIVPIVISSLYLNIWYSIFLSLISTVFILLSVYIDHHALHVSHFWNAGMMLTIYLSVGYLARLLNRMRHVEQEKAYMEEKNSILDASLKEKEMLIRETNHRMKNNLSTLSSLIRLSAGGDAQTLVMNLTGRINTFSILFDKLSYSDNDGATIMLRSYIEEIIDLVINTGDVAVDRVSREITGPDYPARSKPASLIGLMINELAMNSIQHAFRAMGDTPGIIRVALSKVDTGLVMKYRDNGPGFQYAEGMASDGHIGFLLINSIAKQLGGKISHAVKNGSEFTILFADPDLILAEESCHL